jgi:hypothetical protein
LHSIINLFSVFVRANKKLYEINDLLICYTLLPSALYPPTRIHGIITQNITIQIFTHVPEYLKLFTTNLFVL